MSIIGQEDNWEIVISWKPRRMCPQRKRVVSSSQAWYVLLTMLITGHYLAPAYCSLLLSCRLPKPILYAVTLILPNYSWTTQRFLMHPLFSYAALSYSRSPPTLNLHSFPELPGELYLSSSTLSYSLIVSSQAFFDHLLPKLNQCFSSVLFAYLICTSIIVLILVYCNNLSNVFVLYLTMSFLRARIILYSAFYNYT